MRVLLSTLGSHGDVLPMLAIGRALAARGAFCEVAAHRLFAPEIARAGLEAAPIMDAFPLEATLRHPDLYHPIRNLAVGARILEPLMLAFAADLRAVVASRRPDILVAHYAGIPARWIAREAGLPCAVVTLAPAAWNNAADPVPVYQLAPSRRGRRARFLRWAIDPMWQHLFRGWADGFYRRAGFRGARADHIERPEDARASPGFWDEMRAGDLNLGMWAAAYRAPLTGDPPHGLTCGFPWDHGSSPALDPALEAFLAAGDPPVVFTLGSAAVHNPGDFFALAARACERLGRRGVLLIGSSAAPRALPASVFATPWAAHDRLFPRAAVNVHHGGIGSTAQALRAGRPSLGVPHAYDQFNNTVRVHALGAGLVLARHDVTLARLTAALEEALGDAGLATRARELASQVQGDGAEVAAAAIARLAASRRAA